MGKDPVALRKLNTSAPRVSAFIRDQLVDNDSGDFSAVLTRPAAADWDGFPARKAASEARGRRRGRGIGNFLECTAPPMKEQGELIFEQDGSVTIVTGTLDYGQGHWTPFAQVLHGKLGVPFGKIRLVQGDSDRLVAGGGTGGSKSLMASGAAILQAADIVIEKGRRAAGFILEAAAEDIDFAEGRFTIAGTDRGIGIMELAARLRETGPLPEDVPASLDSRTVFDEAPMAYPNGCHICEVEIDPETGQVRIDRYTRSTISASS